MTARAEAGPAVDAGQLVEDAVAALRAVVDAADDGRLQICLADQIYLVGAAKALAKVGKAERRRERR